MKKKHRKNKTAAFVHIQLLFTIYFMQDIAEHGA